MNTRLALATAGVVLVVLAIALFGRHDRASQISPPDLAYGQDVCARCNMIISDQRFATALVLRDSNGEQATHAFDDIGCAIEYEKGRAGTKILARYVADFGSRQWLDADKATYVRGGRIVSPMGYGTAACRDRQAGMALSTSLGGELLDHAALQARLDSPAVDGQASAMTETAEHDHSHDHP